MFQCYFYHPLPFPGRYLIPELPRWPVAVCQPLIACCHIPLIPLVKGAAGYAQLRERLGDTDRRAFHQPDDLHLLFLTVPHIPCYLYSSPLKLFFSTRFCRVISATNCFNCSFSFRSSLTSSLVASRIVSPFSLRLPASRNDLLHL